jgi:hypothetical protein
MGIEWEHNVIVTCYNSLVIKRGWEMPAANGGLNLTLNDQIIN